MRTLTLIVDEAWNGSTVKHLLRARLHMAEGLIARVKLRETGLMRNGERVFTNARLRTGDVLCVEIGDEGAVNEALPIAAPLTFVYEDEDIAVLNKSPDMAVHGSTGGQGCTVANALAALWGRDAAFHPVSRLDRGTSGIMVIAKSAYVHDLLRRMLHTDAFRREYLALARGCISGRFRHGRSPHRAGRSRADEARHHTGRAAVAHGVHGSGALSRGSAAARPPAHGRTHQIRVHMAAIGHPLFGDALYGSPDDMLSRPALHSAYLSLRHPVTGETLELCRSAAGRSRKKDGGAPPPLNTPPPACRKHRQRGRCNYRKLIS